MAKKDPLFGGFFAFLGLFRYPAEFCLTGTLNLLSFCGTLSREGTKKYVKSQVLVILGLLV